MEVEWKVSAVPENHDGGAVCRYSSAQNEPGCHLLTYFVSQGTGMEGKVSKITQPRGRSHSGSGPTVYGDRENSKPRGQSWEQPKSR